MGVLGECFFAAEERGKTRKCWRREFLTTNDTSYTNEGDGVLGDLKFARREKVVSGQCARAESGFLVVWGGCKVGVLGECFFAAEER